MWSLHFCGMLLLPGIGLRLGCREALLRWLASREGGWKLLCSTLAYPALILLEQASCRDVYIPQAAFPLPSSPNILLVSNLSLLSSKEEGLSQHLASTRQALDGVLR